MGWHDCAVHALAVEPATQYPGRLLVDLDYIVGWVCPTPPADTFDFWICPATLVFDEAWDLADGVDVRGSALSCHSMRSSGPFPTFTVVARGPSMPQI